MTEVKCLIQNRDRCMSRPKTYVANSCVIVLFLFQLYLFHSVKSALFSEPQWSDVMLYSFFPFISSHRYVDKIHRFYAQCTERQTNSCTVSIRWSWKMTWFAVATLVLVLVLVRSYKENNSTNC